MREHEREDHVAQYHSAKVLSCLELLRKTFDQLNST